MAAGSVPRSAMRRLMKELDTWNTESAGEQGIERLGPVSDDELLTWESVINGRGVGYGYDNGRWLLRISIPPAYPLQPPQISFATPVVHPNVSLETGEICLDLLKDKWTPAYSVLNCVRAIRLLLSTPGVESPLNVDVAALLRAGDALGARRLVELWVEEERYEGK
ncbi:putative ubiquitin protein [Parathielavia hyrcaniae]|uniref:Ubiquitin protein n=1 Tax=Parathielavia hyrcaniae TaxID=113614 RepID=A0AAN6Q8U2_9PEZI|nr:putative ubiquitin protein [Parathielavia hyrcaniae]